MNIAATLATELGVRDQQVAATIALLDDGATVPFIARYRKEATGALDDAQLRTLAERLGYLRELESRRQSILASIGEQGKLTDALSAQILAADTKGRLEDLYLPFKPKRRSKAQQAREAGLEPLALGILEGRLASPEAAAAEFINDQLGIESSKAALEGAQQILMELFAEHADTLGKLRDWLWRQAQIQVAVVRGKRDENSKYRDYFEHSEALAKMPSHRALAVLRGVREGILKCSLEVSAQDHQYAQQQLARPWSLPGDRSARANWLAQTIERCWQQKLLPQLETQLIKQCQSAAEGAAIEVFGKNLKDLLLAAPAGQQATLGLDPGLRTGVKVVVVDATGKLLEHTTLYPHPPRKDWQAGQGKLANLIKRHQVALISIGNGTASRETEQWVRELLKQQPELSATAVVVSEAGASVYSASELASEEFPELDVSLRGAVSIARRLQDPLAELVKIEPKAIGVGQYQHDVDQKALGTTLEAVVEDCVNHVGVELNSASAALLSQVAGIGNTLAKNIVDYRDSNGRFASRKQLLKVPRLGAKAFEQCAGFLRIHGAKNPLDNSAVHPESYPLVAELASSAGCSMEQLLSQPELLAKLDARAFIGQQYGEFTVRDIIKELEKPGRDPRPAFKTAQFAEGIEKPSDLEPGMQLEGVVSNVTNFGAFVDIGVHQDGLVHISQLADRFVADPHQVVSAGDIVKVWVQEVDLKRQRISLTMKNPQTSNPAKANRAQHSHKPKAAKPQPQGSLAAGLAAALKGGAKKK